MQRKVLSLGAQRSPWVRINDMDKPQLQVSGIKIGHVLILMAGMPNGILEVVHKMHVHVDGTCELNHGSIWIQAVNNANPGIICSVISRSELAIHGS